MWKTKNCRLEMENPLMQKKKISLNLTSCEVKIQTFDLIYML